MLIETNRLILKEILLSDAPNMFAYMNDYETTKYLFRGAHKTIEDTINYINKGKNTNDMDLLGVYLKDSSVLIGHVAMLFEPVNDILWAFNKEYQGKGYAYEAASVFIDYIFEKYNLDIIDGHADIRNLPSIKLMEKLKMKRTMVEERVYPDERGISKEVGFVLFKDSESKTIKINGEKISCDKVNNVLYFTYNNTHIALINEKLSAKELCIYPNVWKYENRFALPSVIHHEESVINEYQSNGFKKLMNVNDNYLKIIVFKDLDRVTIHGNGMNKTILNPEDEVNNIHFVLQNELDSYLKNIGNYIEYKKYRI